MDGLPDTEKMEFDYNVVEMQTSRADLQTLEMYPFYKNTKYVVFFTSSSIFLMLDLLPWFYNKKYNGLFTLFNNSKEDIIILKENLKENIFYTFCYLYILYLMFVFYFWFNYIWFGIQ
jgi:hypothetical protein